MEDDKNIFKKQLEQNFKSGLSNLLEALSDKDDVVKGAAEAAIIKIADRKPDDTLLVLCEYRKSAQKIQDSLIAVILRIIEHVTSTNIRLLENDSVLNCIDFTVHELTKNSEPNGNIQKPCVEILVSIGRIHCKSVMDTLLKHLGPHKIGHFMILETIGRLADVNMTEIIPYVKSTLAVISPMLSLIKNDYVKVSYAYCIHRFCDAVMEYQTHTEKHSTESALSCEPDLDLEVSESESLNEEDPETVKEAKTKGTIDISTEIGFIYDIIMHQWLNSRDAKLCAELLYGLSMMFPLLPVDKLLEQTNKIIPMLLNMFRRSIDRASITSFLASVIKTAIKLDPQILDSHAQITINTLFDLICVNPDFEKLMAAKSHFEVLRCYDLLAKNYGDKVLEIILLRLKSNDDRDKIKSLLLLTHLTNSSDEIVQRKIKDFLSLLRVMVLNEKTFKMKVALLKTIIAFSQKGFVDHKLFVKFIIHHCCQLMKVTPDQLVKPDDFKEATEFITTCNNSLVLLSRTVPTMENLLKVELLQNYLVYEYTDACPTIAKCMAALFHKNPEINVNNDPYQENGIDPLEEDRLKFITEEQKVNITSTIINIPSPESVFVRSLVLTANFENKDRIEHVLNFLQAYCPNLNKHLQPLWNDRIPELLASLKTNDDDKFYKDLNQFVQLTIKDMDDPKFSEALVNKLSDQLSLYTPKSHASQASGNLNQLQQELKVPPLIVERGMLLKLLGLCLCYVTDVTSIDAKIELIFDCVRQEKLEKIVHYKELEEKFLDPAKSLGFLSRTHYDLLVEKFKALIREDGMKKSSSIFSILSKDTQKENDRFKFKILIIFSCQFIVENTAKYNILSNKDGQNDKLIEYLSRQLTEMKECQIKKIILSTFLKIAEIYLESITGKNDVEFKHLNDMLSLILHIPIDNKDGGNKDVNSGNNGFYDYLPLYPNILKLSTVLIKLSKNAQHDLDGTNLLNMISHHFFTAAQSLNTDNEEQQCYLAPHINNSIPEVNSFIKALLERNPSPAGLDDIISILEQWIKDKNSQVRICATLIMEAALHSYIKTMKIGCEAPSKFHQTGSMLGKIVPRTIDTSARVRETSVNILRKILEIACIYETLTIPDSNMEWVKELKSIKEDITIENNKEICDLGQRIALVISQRLSNLQYVQFSKTLLYSLNDHDQSASAGAGWILTNFIQFKGSEMFHAIPELVKDSLHALRTCPNLKTKVHVYNTLLALTKHHPKLVCQEMLLQVLPYEENVVEYWKTLTQDKDLFGTILDNFLTALYSEKLYEAIPGEVKEERSLKTLAHQPFAIICAIKEFLSAEKNEGLEEIKSRLPQIFSMLLTTLASYTNTIPSMIPPNQSTSESSNGVKTTPNPKTPKSSKFSFIPNRDVVKTNPCQIVQETFVKMLGDLEMEQIKNVLTMSPQLASSVDLNNFIDFLSPLAVAAGNYFAINSNTMKQVITELTNYSNSQVDAQRIAAIGFFSFVVPLKPCGEISSVIILHLISALSDPNPLVRGLSIKGLAFVGALCDHDIEKYSEVSLAALLKGIDDYNPNCYINIPLESLRGISRILEAISREKMELFEVSLAIRIRPFFENESIEIREAAIFLFGDLCNQAKNKKGKQAGEIEEALREEILKNLFPMLLHLGENESMISRACKTSLRHMCALLKADKLNEKAQEVLEEFYQLNFDVFMQDFVQLVCQELPDHLSTFIETCLPFIKSYWSEIRGNACLVIGLLQHYGTIENEETRKDLEKQSSDKIGICLKDDSQSVRLKACEALGFVFSL